MIQDVSRLASSPNGNGEKEDTKTHKMNARHRYTSKRLVASVLILIIVTVGLTQPWKGTPQALKSLRIDSVPQDAYVIPWMKPYPSPWFLTRVDPKARSWSLDTIMNGSLKINFTLNIAIPNGTRIVQTTAYFGHDEDYLYFGAIFRGMYGNPTSTNTIGNMNEFDLLFDPEDSMTLNSRESGSSIGLFISCGGTWGTCPEGWSNANGWSIEDAAWTSILPESNHGGWISPSFLGCNQPLATFGPATEYQASTGTLQLLFARVLRQPGACANTLQINPGERWVIRSLLVMGYPNNGERLFYDPSYVDAWPAKPNPLYLSNTAGWAEMVIDLTTPRTQEYP